MGNVLEIREKRLREARMFTQGECAKVVGVSTPTYRKLEQHPENFTKAQAERLAEHLGCKEKDIFL